MGEMMSQMGEQMATLPQYVQIWTNWMLLIVVVSVVFVWHRKSARYVLLSLPILIGTGLAVFRFTGNAHLLGIAHLLVWIPLFYYLYKVEVKSDGFKFQSIFGAWIGLLMTTMAISLVLDVRDVTLILTGYK